MSKVYVTTNGCEEGQLKSMHVQQFFTCNGFTLSKDHVEADIIIFFACGLTNQKEKHSLYMIRKLQAEKRNAAKLVVWGCLPKINPKSLIGVYDGPIVGPKDLGFFEEFLGKTVIAIEDLSANSLVPKETCGEAELKPESIIDPVTDILRHLGEHVDRVRLPRRTGLFDEASFFIRVAEGCTGKCTYCSERPAWGKVKSRPVEKIIKEFELGLRNGYKRFFLVAADLGSYGVDIGCNAVDLLREIVRIDEHKNYKVIINQMNPLSLKELLPSLEEPLDSGKIEALGCQVESGSNRILQLMGRNYVAEDWRSTMLRINKEFPFVRLSTHIMVGFPTETDQDFEATMRLLDFPLFMDWVGFFIYSSRPTVYASRLQGQVPEEVKQQRFRKLCRKYLYMYTLNVALGNVRYIRSKL